MWGKGEDYLWYSTGASACYTDLKAGHLGEGTLQARYIRGAFDDKPFTLGKYENTRTRVAIAELAANGGAPMGFYTRFEDPAARAEIARYYAFIRSQSDVLRANRPAGEIVLLYPRNRSSPRQCRSGGEIPSDIGTELLNAHVAFDVLPDDLTEKIARDPRPKIDVRDDSTRAALKAIPLSHFDAPPTFSCTSRSPAPPLATAN